MGRVSLASERKLLILVAKVMEEGQWLVLGFAQGKALAICQHQEHLEEEAEAITATVQCLTTATCCENSHGQPRECKASRIQATTQTQLKLSSKDVRGKCATKLKTTEAVRRSVYHVNHGSENHFQ